jgi:hypothetical protein
VKAIETVYKGSIYRSRLEARWAVAFEALGWRYTYEPEGFETADYTYLPDFWVDDLESFVEIKPRPSTSEIKRQLRKALRIQDDMAANGIMLLVLAGDPRLDSYTAHVMPSATGPAETATLFDCRGCAGVCWSSADSWGEIGKHSKRCTDKNERWPCSTDRINLAFMQAMACRFGERS